MWCESWTIKKAEHRRIDVFELWCWRRLLRVPWTSKEIQPVHPKGNTSGYSLEGLMLKRQYFGHLVWRTDSMEKILILGKKVGGEGDDRGWDYWTASLTQWTWVWVNPGSWCWIGRPGMLQSVGLKRFRHDWATYLNWTELNSPIPVHFSSLIPKMSVFTLAISCLTTSNLPWFMD